MHSVVTGQANLVRVCCAAGRKRGAGRRFLGPGCCFEILGRVYTRYDNGGADATATALSERGIGGGRADRRCTFTTIKDEGLGSHGPAWILVRAPCS